MNKYLFITLMNLLPMAADAQLTVNQAPRLVVSIVIDQLRSDDMENFYSLYQKEGFRRLLWEGKVFEAAGYPFTPVDRASAITCVVTGTTPLYNRITARKWFNRNTLRPVFCVADSEYEFSPANIATSTISDELKISTDGKALVYGIAESEDEAILSAGHAADGAFWVDRETGHWRTSTYYPEEARTWVEGYNNSTLYFPRNINEKIAAAALKCINDNQMGSDPTTDFLAVTLSARADEYVRQRTEMSYIYSTLDRNLGNLISQIEEKVGKDNVLFVVTSTGEVSEPEVDYSRFRIPTGTFYINRTSNLLNMYLSAIYGTGRWVDGYYRNQIYLNHKLIEDRKVGLSEILQRSTDLLMMSQGVRAVSYSSSGKSVSGDLLVEVNPGWKVLNEDTQETYRAQSSFVSFPVIFMGNGIHSEHISTPVTTDRIASTIAKCLHIRAPNASASAPLF